MKRIIILLLVCFSLSFSGCAGIGFGKNISEIPLRFEGFGYSHMFLDDGFLVYSHKADRKFIAGSSETVITYFNAGADKQWEFYDENYYVNAGCAAQLPDGTVVILVMEGEIYKLIAINKDGGQAWETQFSEGREIKAVLYDKGQILVVGSCYSILPPFGEYQNNLFFINISPGGEMAEPVWVSGGIVSSLYNALAFDEGGYILHGRGDIGKFLGDSCFIARFSEDFNIEWVYRLETDECTYTSGIATNGGRILLMGFIDWESPSDIEYCFIRELDSDGKVVFDEKHENEDVSSIAYLPGGRAAAVFYYTEERVITKNTLRTYSADSRKTKKKDFDYDYAVITPAGDNIIVIGERIEKNDTNTVLGMLSDLTGRKKDTAVTFYNKNLRSLYSKAYKAEDGKSGYNFFAFADSEGNVYIESGG
ncbi:MAG: hypothetical protein FWF08_07575 [Oscillospiraceae bacterium]|nr:hypothetical protein [Oscillospiraceae bacterium]